MVNSFYDYIFFLSVRYLTRASFFMLRVKTCQRKINLNTVSGQQPSYLRSNLPSASLFIRGLHLRRLAFPHVSSCAITDCNIQRQDWHFLGNLYRQIHPKLKRSCLSFAYHGLDAAVWEMRYRLGELPCSDPSSATRSVALGKLFQLPGSLCPPVCTKEQNLCLKKSSSYQNTSFDIYVKNVIIFLFLKPRTKNMVGVVRLFWDYLLDYLFVFPSKFLFKFQLVNIQCNVSFRCRI